jgi:flagellar biosynthesis protein FlhB
VFRYVQKIFSIKQFIQTLATILLGIVAFAFAMKAWMDTNPETLPKNKAPEVDVMLIHSGEVKIVKAQWRTLAAVVAKIDCV